MADVTQQPFWVPSKSLQLKMVEHAHALVQVLNQVRGACDVRSAGCSACLPSAPAAAPAQRMRARDARAVHSAVCARTTQHAHIRTPHPCCAPQGAQFLDSLDDIAVPGVVLVDGMDIWGPQKAVGLTQLKLWLAGWLQLYDVNAAVTAMAATPSSNKARARVFACMRPGMRSEGCCCCRAAVWLCSKQHACAQRVLWPAPQHACALTVMCRWRRHRCFCASSCCLRATRARCSWRAASCTCSTSRATSRTCWCTGARVTVRVNDTCVSRQLGAWTGCLRVLRGSDAHVARCVVCCACRNGTPQEMAERFIGASSSSSGGRRSRSGGGGGLGAWRRRLWQQRERLRRRR